MGRLGELSVLELIVHARPKLEVEGLQQACFDLTLMAQTSNSCWFWQMH